MMRWPMKMGVVVALASMLVVARAEDVKVEMLGGISTTTHEKSPLAARPKQALLDNREPTDGEQKVRMGIYVYELKWTATLRDPREEVGDAKLMLRVWIPTLMMFPGWNSPMVEIWSGEKRLGCQVLSEVGWPADVWTAGHERAGFLYVRTKHRHRIADGECVYELDPKEMKLVYKGVFFSKEELAKESEVMKKMAGEGKKEAK